MVTAYQFRKEQEKELQENATSLGMDDGEEMICEKKCVKNDVSCEECFLSDVLLLPLCALALSQKLEYLMG